MNLRIGAVPDYLWDETEMVVDCLLGTGATGELKGRVAEWAARINAAGARGVPVIAVDVPSGVDASTGAIAAGSVAADVTVTFHAAKSGIVCPPGSEAAGEVVVWDIGIPAFLEPEPDLWVVTEEDVEHPRAAGGRPQVPGGVRGGACRLEGLSGRRVAGVAGGLQDRGGIRPSSDACRGRGERAEPAGGDGAARRSGQATSSTTPGRFSRLSATIASAPW